MPTAGKVFVTLEPTPLSEIATGLQGWREEEVYREGDYEFTLITEVANLTLGEDSLTGLYSYDYVVHNYHRGRIIPSPATKEVLFSFNERQENLFLIVVEKKEIANRIANRLSEIIYGEMGRIVEARILPETLKEFHLANPEHTSVIFFENMDIPNVNKLSLYGPDLTGTSLFDQYAARGDPWYVLTKSRKHGHTVGIVRDGSVTIFNRVDKGEYLRYVADEILPLIQPPRRA
ncbi:hypothetical protein CW700_01430 [Candidatus Bathyarchaeota archaeon]|nr:MAG: hypothetical protein CW700_01430 [Candidatus Bathyarchaeota archaeon]